MKLSRNESGLTLVKKLNKLGYEVTRQKGSHIRLTRISEESQYHITIPSHNPIKIGLLSKIIGEVALQLKLSKEELLKLLEQ